MRSGLGGSARPWRQPWSDARPLPLPRNESVRSVVAAVVLPAALLVTSVSWVLDAGRDGFMPCDHSIVFDGAWRLLGGQVPYRDFVTPCGLVPIAMQVPFFQLLGVSWFAYVLHAALVNGAFVLVLDRLLRGLGVPRWAATACSLAGGLFLYPAMGVPFMDQHAFFFSALAMLVASEAVAATGGKRTALFAALPGVLLAAVLSKQVPTVLLLPAMAVLALRRGLPSRRDVAVSVAAALAILLGLLGAALWAAVDLRLVVLHAFRLPLLVGQERAADPASRMGSLAAIRQSGSLALPAVLVMAPLMMGAGVVAWARLRGRTGPSGGEAVVRAGAAWGIAAATLLFIRFTNNEPQLGLPLVPLCIGLLAAPSFSGARWRRAGRVAALGLLALLARDAFVYRTAVVETRRALGEVLGGEEGADRLPQELGYLKFRVPREYRRLTAGGLGDVVAYLRSHPGSFWLHGDSSILYALTGRPSVNPALWFHPGLTIPLCSDPEFARYEGRLMESLARNDVRFVVLEGKSSWMGSRVEQTPRVAAWIAEREVSRRSFGSFTVLELQPTRHGSHVARS